MHEALLAQVRALPEKPGVYLYRDARGRVLYVGKAANVRARVRSYFGSPGSLLGKTRTLMSHVTALETLVTGSEQEALHLEATLVKRHQPPYNVHLKDDKHYPYLKVDVRSPWPRVFITRRVQDDGARYFGPFASAGAVRTTLDLVKKLFPWRSCTKTITGADPRPCLDYYIHRCIAPCTAYCTPEKYRTVIDQVLLFLDGKTDVVLRDLRRQMAEAAGQLDFERAAQIRDQIDAVERTTETQVAATTAGEDADAFGLALDGDEAVVQVFYVRGSKIRGRDQFLLEGARDEADPTVLGAFLNQFYESATRVPRLVLLPTDVDDRAVLQDWLRQKRGGRVDVRVPVRGEKRRLVGIAGDNAREALAMRRVQWLADTGKTRQALVELQEALHLPAPPHRIECYDISNTQGTNSVASMVVFRDGQPATGEYRRFQIKTVRGANDFASMAEVIRRRFRRLAQMQADEAAAAHLGEQSGQRLAADGGEAEDSGGWGATPDLVIVDGGKGQLAAALDVLRDLGLADIPAAGLAKRQEELFVADMQEPVLLDRHSQGLYLIQRLRDEAHRFAITYHRSLRQKRGLTSALDTIPGVGPKRKQALLRKYGTLQAIRDADPDDLAATVGMTHRLAATVKAQL